MASQRRHNNVDATGSDDSPPAHVVRAGKVPQHSAAQLLHANLAAVASHR
jgi:hypothetical protein